MIDYGLITQNTMIGTMKYCIENFPEDFDKYKYGNLINACELANLDVDIAYMLDDIPNVDKQSLYGNILTQPCISHKLLRKDFFDPNTPIHHSEMLQAFQFYIKFGCKYPNKRNQYLRMFIRKILKHRININLETIDKYYLDLPKELREYFFKTINYIDSTENALEIISKFHKDYNSLTYFFRHCKPNLQWNKLIHSINEETFYRIISITNRMKAFKNISCSYDDMKKQYVQKIPEGYSKIITEYLKQYTENSFRNQLINPQVHTMDFGDTLHVRPGGRFMHYTPTYQVRRPNPILSTRA